MEQSNDLLFQVLGAHAYELAAIRIKAARLEQRVAELEAQLKQGQEAVRDHAISNGVVLDAIPA